MAFLVFVGAARAHPFINFGELELTQSADLVRGQALAFSPAVDGVLHNPQMLRDLLGGNPRFSVHRFGAREAPLKSSRNIISLTKWHFAAQLPSLGPPAKA